MADADYIPVSAQEARVLGAKTYSNGKPCKRGHLGLRYTVDQGCVTCKLDATERRKLRAKVDPALAATMRSWYRKSKAKARLTPEGKRAHYEANRRYNEANREKVNDYYRGRRQNSPTFGMACWMRSTLHKVLTRANQRKDARCVELLGYTSDELRRHIEAQFIKGMGWHNRDRWHIDHIVPVAEHLRRGETSPATINALSNLRPMWAEENRRKRDAVTHLL